MFDYLPDTSAGRDPLWMWNAQPGRPWPITQYDQPECDRATLCSRRNEPLSGHDPMRPVLPERDDWDHVDLDTRPKCPYTVKPVESYRRKGTTPIPVHDVLGSIAELAWAVANDRLAGDA